MVFEQYSGKKIRFFGSNSGKIMFLVKIPGTFFFKLCPNPEQVSTYRQIAFINLFLAVNLYSI